MYDIKYSIFKFKVRFLQDSTLNINKQSAIRGIIGNMLIAENCIMPKEKRECNICSFNKKCLAYNIFSPQIKNGGNDEGVSPFVIICDDKREFIEKGGEMTFAMIFFSDTPIFIPTIIKVVEKSGKYLGVEKNYFKLLGVYNDEENEIYDGKTIYPLKINVKKVQEYIDNRLSISEDVSILKIVTPIRFKKNKRFHDDISGEDLINLVKRRLITLYSLEERVIEFTGNFNLEVKGKEIYWEEFNRYSNRQNARMSLGGVKGVIEFGEVSVDAKKMLIAGELINIGKSTALGLGDYILY